MMEIDPRTEGEILEELQADINVPWIYRWTKISHYYGDTVRGLLVIGAVLMLVSAPFYADDIKVELPFIVLGAVIMVWVAAFTSPWKQGIISADAITAGVGLTIYEIWALSGYDTELLHKFVFREAIAMIFLFAFYFSTKTLRNMLLHKIGRPDTPLDILNAASKSSLAHDDDTDFRHEASKILEKVNSREKLDFND